MTAGKLRRLEDATARAEDDAVNAAERGDSQAWKRADARRGTAAR